jgi:rSAM/selenodomain-associated transferase 2/rSAM/selenodomain-associated transferase 1
MKATVCLFAKSPLVGMAKTRLAPVLGLVGAAKFADALLQDALASWGESELLIAHTGMWKPEVWDALSDHSHMPQGPGDLGQRMERVLRAALTSSDVVMAVGTDIPGLGDADAELAIDALQTHDAVLGPSLDGGFYLLGLKAFPSGLLGGVPWSSSETLEATSERLKAAGMSVALLPERFDVDDARDLRLLHTYLSDRPGAMPHTRNFFDSEHNQSISVVMPVLNEDARLNNSIEALREIPGLAQVVVADGGSCDASLAVARSHPEVTVVQSAKGRGRQMNSGAQHSFGGILLFLHADARLPADATAQIRGVLSCSEVAGGAFRIRTEYDSLARKRSWTAPFLRLADMRSRYTNFPYGDQAPFVRASAFRALGGYRDIPLFEDLEFAQRLHQRGGWGKAPGTVRVSGRRFQERPFYYLGLMNAFPLLYRLGVSPDHLAAFYQQTR